MLSRSRAAKASRIRSPTSRMESTRSGFSRTSELTTAADADGLRRARISLASALSSARPAAAFLDAVNSAGVAE
jgi:hypothetical protein